MQSFAGLLVVTIAFGGAVEAKAQASTAASAHAHHASPAANATDLDIAANALPAVAVADRFGKALSAGDMATVEELLDPSVLVLETGGAERSRSEYMGHHAASDAKFLNGAHQQLKRRTARSEGHLAWVGSESELHASRDGKPLTVLSTETMVLKKTGDAWRIVHIHWSSR